MCIVRVILRQLLALPCELGFVCLRDFLSAEELSKAVEGRCTAEWVQSTYATSAWTSLVPKKVCQWEGHCCQMFAL